MDPIKITNISKNIAFSLINVGSYMYYLPNHLKYKSLIQRNVELKDIHKGDTCYILGNGPSINQLDIQKIVGKNIFTVNAMVCTPLFEKLKPQYHCVVDRKVFQQHKDELLDKVQTSETKFFFHRKIVDEIGAVENAYYTYNTLLPTGKHLQIDLTKNSNAFINVVPYCIMIALYMGFSEIILLGCDFSFFASRRNVHFYENQKEAKREETLFQDLLGSAIACQQYRYLYEYARDKGVSIFNATPDSLLDTVPHINFDEQCI